MPQSCLTNRTAAVLACTILFPMALQSTPAIADRQTSEGFALQAGGFVAVAPKYEGSKEYDIIGAPFVAPAGDGVLGNGVVQFRGPDDMRFRILNSNGFEAGPLAGYRFDRDEDESRRLHGLGDVDGGLIVGGYAAYRTGAFMPFVSYHHDVTSDDKTGGVLRFGAEAKTEVMPGIMLTAAAGASWADDDYMAAFFSVTPAQNTNSVAGLGIYDAEGGIKDVYFGLSGDIPVTDTWTLKLSGRYTHLVGDAADSPIVETESQFFGGLGLTYRFTVGR